ncbi:MAG: 50S ribosomal protein L14e [Candidatus Aenigmarchaeota archaeon]|nr:50S ribosomal protein L14e [Candidatus Aenigmarchaeota archaeon]
MMLEKGRICLKIAGREAGKYCVVVEPQNTSFVLITGPKTITRIKRRKCNVLHLEPTEHKLDIGSGTDLEIENAWKNSGLIEKLNIKLPRFREPKEESKK